MKQIIQNLKSGETVLEEIPVPEVRRGSVLIRTTRTLVSLGTERMLVEFGKANLIAKARQQPDKVKQVLDKIKTEGLMPTLEAVFNKLDQPIPLGYCHVGQVMAVGEGVYDFQIGDRVVSNGNHAEVVCIPQNLVAKIPDNVTDDEAAFTVIGAIGLQGVRLCNPTLGETIVVIGLGLIGLMTAELLKANGCRVIGIDFDESKLQIARQKGIIAINPKSDDPVKAVLSLTNEIGADGVLITASAKTNDIIAQAAQMSRKRGRIVLIGVIGLDISRADFYEKELSFQVSCSYGPGRYDENYEQKGQDYPIGFVRWTEKRNFEAILYALSTKALDVNPLITERVALADYNQIYGAIGSSRSIASLLVYERNDAGLTDVVQVGQGQFKGQKGVIGIIGAGNFTKMTVLPAIKGLPYGKKYIASAGGVSAALMAKKYAFSHATTNYKQILQDAEVDLVMITTRHDQHARMTVEAIEAGKHVFVEKPLALNITELNEIVSAAQKSPHATVTVGFNRRFSPHIQKAKQLLGNGKTPVSIVATMNAGAIPPNVWVHDMKVGGGRIIGEACHYIDLITYLTGSKVTAVCMNAMGENPKENTDVASILLRMANGSHAVINYFANGSKKYSKERLEVYSQERTLVIDNFRTTTGYGFKGFSSLKTSIDKGHKAQFTLLAERVQQGGAPLIPFDELVNTAKASFAAIESLVSGKWVEIE